MKMTVKLKGFRICWDCSARKYGLTSGKKLLKLLYVEKKLSTNNIAKIFGCSNSSIQDWLRFYNIPIRSKGRR
jgi:transposase